MLCALLFKKFRDGEHPEMNFKKLLISKCQSQFYKMLRVKAEKRRRLSMASDQSYKSSSHGAPSSDD